MNENVLHTLTRLFISAVRQSICNQKPFFQTHCTDDM